MITKYFFLNYPSNSYIRSPVMHKSVHFIIPFLHLGILLKKFSLKFGISLFHISLISDRVSFICLVSCIFLCPLNHLDISGFFFNTICFFYTLILGLLKVSFLSLMFAIRFLWQTKNINICSGQSRHSLSLCLISLFASRPWKFFFLQRCYKTLLQFLFWIYGLISLYLTL